MDIVYLDEKNCTPYMIYKPHICKHIFWNNSGIVIEDEKTYFVKLTGANSGYGYEVNKNTFKESKITKKLGNFGKNV